MAFPVFGSMAKARDSVMAGVTLPRTRLVNWKIFEAAMSGRFIWNVAPATFWARSCALSSSKSLRYLPVCWKYSFLASSSARFPASWALSAASPFAMYRPLAASWAADLIFPAVDIAAKAFDAPWTLVIRLDMVAASLMKAPAWAAAAPAAAPAPPPEAPIAAPTPAAAACVAAISITDEAT